MNLRSLSLAALLMIATGASAQTLRTDAVTLDRDALEIRATQEFSRGQYATALPMLKKLAEMSKDRPEVLAPIQEKIRVCERNLAAGGAAAGATPGATTQPAGPRTPLPKPTPGQIMEFQIKTLGNFEFDADKGGNIPADVQALNGQRVRLKGYMIPMDQAANITQFAMVPDLFACCFGQAPQVQHTVIANCPKGRAVSYYPEEITVEGTLKVGEKRDEGFIVSIFEIDVTSVKPSVK